MSDEIDYGEAANDSRFLLSAAVEEVIKKGESLAEVSAQAVDVVQNFFAQQYDLLMRSNKNGLNTVAVFSTFVHEQLKEFRKHKFQMADQEFSGDDLLKTIFPGVAVAKFLFEKIVLGGKLGVSRSAGE